ncbi:MAG: helix-turn-helix domain-containing protein [Bacteroidales bacterium]|nr:helix-turn-helix domain-containing protein [Bacteroidales bacterium]
MKQLILLILLSMVTPHDDRYTESTAMSHHRTEPERALTLIDSAVIVGNLSWQRGEYLKAVTLYGGMHDMDAARQTCLDMLEQKEALSDTATLENTYMLLAGIEYTQGNHPAIIRYATEASRLAHLLNLPAEIGNAESLIAQSMAQTGRTDEGIERLQNTIAELSQLNTFKGVTAYHETSKKLVRIYLDNLKFAEVVPVCEASLERIGELESHPEHFSGMKEGFDPSEFIDYAKGQTLAYLTIAYARMGELAKARKTEAAVFRTQWSQSIDCDKIMSAAYAYMGEFDRFEQAMSRFENSYPDTINPNYVICLEQRSEAARMQGHIDEALSYMQRAYLIRDSLDARNQREELNKLATEYHLQEEQFIRQQKETEAKRARTVIVALIIGLVATIGFLVWVFRQKRLEDKKNRVLAREIAEAITYKEKWLEREELGVKSEALRVESEVDPDRALFLQIQELVIREKLFLDPSLDRQTLVDRLGLSKERIGAAFAKGSPFKSLIEFLNDCRLPYAAKLLTERPDLSIAEVAKESGFPSADTLGRNFKQRFTLTPTQFRDQHP